MSIQKRNPFLDSNINLTTKHNNTFLGQSLSNTYATQEARFTTSNFDDPGSGETQYTQIITDKYTIVITQINEHKYRAHADARSNGWYYFFKDEYAIYTTYDLRTGIAKEKRINSSARETLVHSTEITMWEYLKIKAFGKDNALSLSIPQVQIFGSGIEDPGLGTPANPQQPIYTFDYGQFSEMMGLITAGMEAEIPTMEPNRLVELVRKGLDQQLDRLLNKEPEDKRKEPPFKKEIYTGEVKPVGSSGYVLEEKNIKKADNPNDPDTNIIKHYNKPKIK